MTEYEKDFLRAYYNWVNTPTERYGDRVVAWEEYVSVRDKEVNKKPSISESLQEFGARRIVQ